MSHSTRLGTGTVNKINYQHLAVGELAEAGMTSGLIASLEPPVTTPAKRTKIANSHYTSYSTGRRGRPPGSTNRPKHSPPNQNGMVHHIHAARRRPVDSHELWPCLQCGYQKLTSPESLADHLDLCEGVPPTGGYVPGFGGIQLDCPLCLDTQDSSEQFTNLQDLDSHIALCHKDVVNLDTDSPFYCAYCNFSCLSMVMLVQHKLHHHQIYPNLEYVDPVDEVHCSGCSQVFSSTAHFQLHLSDQLDIEGQQDPDCPTSLCPGLVAVEMLLCEALDEDTVVLSRPLSATQLRQATHLEANFEAKYPLARIGLRMTPFEYREPGKMAAFPISRTKAVSPKKRLTPPKTKLLSPKTKSPPTASSIVACQICKTKCLSPSHLRQHMASLHPDFLMSQSDTLDDTINDVLSSIISQPLSLPQEAPKPKKSGGLRDMMKEIRERKRAAREERERQEMAGEISKSEGELLPTEGGGGVLAVEEDAEMATFEDFMEDLERSVAEKPSSVEKLMSLPTTEKKIQKQKTPKPKRTPLTTQSKPGQKRLPSLLPKKSANDVAQQEQGLYACPLCVQSFNLLRSRDEHLIEKHNGEKVFACQICGITFALYGNLNGHCKRVHMEDLERALYGDPDAWEMPHECPLCFVAFAGELVLRSHSHFMHRNQKLPRTSSRGRGRGRGGRGGGRGGRKMPSDTSSTASSRLELLSGHHGAGTGAFLCTECAAEFPSETKLRHHMANEHPLSDEENQLTPGIKPAKKSRPGPMSSKPKKETPCILPPSSYAPVSCRLCKAQLHNPLEFHVHFRMHLGPQDEEQYGCQLCGQVFSGKHSRFDLMDHSQVEHAGRPPFVCPQCSATFVIQRHLVRHRAGGICGARLDLVPAALEDVVMFGCANCDAVFVGQDERERYEAHKSECVGMEDEVDVDVDVDSHHLYQQESHPHVIEDPEMMEGDWEKEVQTVLQ